MNVRIAYQTQYAYAAPVTFWDHTYRLFPKAERHLRVLRSSFTTNLGALVNYRRDLFDNEIASVFYPGQSTLLQASFDCELAIEPRNAFGFLLTRSALEFPFTYSAIEQRLLAPYLTPAAPIDLPFWPRPQTPQPTVDALVTLNSALHRNLRYERREEGQPHPPEELLRRGSGACRDFAVLLAEVLRGLGIASRLASGYLCEFGDGSKVAEGALHAWTEAYLPGAGWVGMDPTNGTFCDHHHLTAAVGLTPDDITPIHGGYSSDDVAAGTMTASLQIIPHD